MADFPIFTDNIIAGILLTINEVEVNVTRAVLRRLSDRDVKAYAELMIRSHSNAIMTLKTFFHVNHIIPKPSTKTQAIEQTGKEILQILSSVAGQKEFDGRFMEAQVFLHYTALGIIQGTLIPYVWSQPFKRILTTDAVPLVADHMNKAKEILEMLMKEKQI